jgi:hypothetical protein
MTPGWCEELEADLADCKKKLADQIEKMRSEIRIEWAGAPIRDKALCDVLLLIGVAPIPRN